jgi:colanic acid/amylovoran biosynthesis glycosyltransferase
VLDGEYGTLFELAADGASEPADAPATSSQSASGPRVVLVTDHFPKFSETFFAHEVSGLLERGWDVHVLCNRSNRDQWPYFPQLAELLESGERIHVISDFEAQLAELRPDVVHFGYGTLALGRMHVRELLGCRVVVSLRGYDINYFGLEDPHCYDDVWDAADLLHLVSVDVWRRAQRRGCPADKEHRVITDAISVEQFAHVDRDHGAVGTAERPLRVVSVGRLHWKKGYEYGLAAVRQLLDWGADVRYRIVGDGPDREAIMFAIHDLGLEQHVELLGVQTASQVREALGWADVCLHAAVSEGFCVSVIEAQANRASRCLLRRRRAGRERRAPGLGLVVPRRDAVALASGLAELASLPELRATMGAAARDRAQRRFDIAGQLDAEALPRRDRGRPGRCGRRARWDGARAVGA